MHVGKQLAIGLKHDNRNSAAKWVETETFPKGLKGKVKVKFSETTWFDRLMTFLAGRKATYGKWVPVTDSAVDRARFLAFKKRYNTQFGKFRGERRTRYTFYVFESITKIVLMFLLAALSRFPTTQSAVSTTFTIVTSALSFYVSPYNDYRKNTNEMTMAVMKPGLFILGLLNQAMKGMTYNELR